jgi:uncharacterized protein YjbI with pentapeptide repeats
LFRHTITQLEVFKLVNQSYGELWLPNTDLRGVDLSGAHLYKACLRSSDLSKKPGAEGEEDVATDLSGADLRYANLCGTILRDADLSETHLNYANMRQADLRGTYLRGANLGEAVLRGAKLDDKTILSEADLREADLRGVDLRDVELDLTDLRETKINDPNNPSEFNEKWRLVWKIVNRDQAERDQELRDLQAKLDALGADILNNASLYEADLSGLDLRELNLYQVDLRATKVDHTQFSRVGEMTWKLVNRAAIREKLDRAEREKELKDLQTKLDALGADGLNKVSLRGADLRGLNLSHLNLSWVDLRETRVDQKTHFCDDEDADRNPIRLIREIVTEGAHTVELNGEAEVDLSQANLRSSDFRGVDARKVKTASWDAALVEGLKFDNETIFADDEGLQEEIKEKLRRRGAKEVYQRQTAPFA